MRHPHDPLLGPYPAAHHYRGAPAVPAPVPPPPDRAETHESITEQMWNDGGDLVDYRFAAALAIVAEAASVSKAAASGLISVVDAIADEILEDVMSARCEDDLPFIGDDGEVVRS